MKKQVLKKLASVARLSVLAKGRTIGLREAGAARDEVVRNVLKSDGPSPTLKTIVEIYARYLADPEWDGEASRASDRPRQLTEADEQKVLQVLVRDAGKVKVIARHVKKCFPHMRHCLTEPYSALSLDLGMLFGIGVMRLHSTRSTNLLASIIVAGR